MQPPQYANATCTASCTSLFRCTTARRVHPANVASMQLLYKEIDLGLSMQQLSAVLCTSTGTLIIDVALCDC